MNFQKDMTLGEIVAKFPSSEQIFKGYKIDYCCGGHRVIEDVAKEEKIDLDNILDALNKEYYILVNSSDKVTDWETAPINDLVEHILQAHHAFLRMNLPIISELTTKILRVHGEHHPELLEVFQTFHQLKMELEAHLIKEETVQYPSIRRFLESNDPADLSKAVNVISELEDEHTFAGDALKELRRITQDYTVPSDGCMTYKKTYEALEELESNTFTHIHLENNILFGRLKAFGE